MNLREVAPTDTVRVTVYRRYGEEQECSDTWLAEVQAIDTRDGGKICVEGNRWLDVRGMNPNGVDPSHTTTRLYVCKNVSEGVQLFQPVFVDGETPALEEFRDRALELTSFIRVAKKKEDREQYSRELASVIRGMYSEGMAN